MLALLLRARNGLVSKDDIASEVWGGADVADQSLARCVYILRRALEPYAGDQVIRTVYGSGWRLVLPVQRVDVLTQRTLLVPDTSASPQTLDLWRLGHEQMGRRSRQEVERAIATLQAAEQSDPQGTAIPLTIASRRIGQTIRGHAPPLEVAVLVKEPLERVLRIVPDHPLGIAIRGWFDALIGRQFASVLSSLDQSVKLQPQDCLIRYCRSWVRAWAGQFDGAIDDAAYAVSHAPSERGYIALYAIMLCFCGRMDEAALYMEKMRVQRPEIDLLHALIAGVLAVQERFAEAVIAGHEAVATCNGDVVPMVCLAYAQAAAGDQVSARKTMAAIEVGNGPRVGQGLMASVWLRLGEDDRARSAMRSADIACDPWFLLLRHSPRLQSLFGEGVASLGN